MIRTKGYAATSPTAPLGYFSFDRRDPGPQDVQIEIMFCGVCHSDLHTVRGDWGQTVYPCVPGHEIVGRAVKVGRDVRKFKEGELVGVGCMVDSCRSCPECQEGYEQYCNDLTWTYGSPDKHSGGPTFGGYSQRIIVDEAFVVRVPENLDPAAASPLLCAGITTYSPLRHWRVGKGQRVGVVGLGGLGHMGVKLANAFGAEVVLFTTSPGKREDGLRLGAHEIVISTDQDAMQRESGKLDFILDTVSAPHDVNSYLDLLRRDGTLTQVGLPGDPLSVNAFSIVRRRRSLAGSLIGGIAETQEMLDFCGERGIVCDIEKIAIDQINEAYARMLRSDVKYRFVIDIATL